VANKNIKNIIIKRFQHKLSAIYAWKIAEENGRQWLVSAYVMRKNLSPTSDYISISIWHMWAKANANNKHISAEKSPLQ